MPPWSWSWPWSTGGEERGEPASSNGASSFHLQWRLDTLEPIIEVAAVLEVVVPPTVDRLYFWALQVSFTGGGIHRGAAHTGLQWNRNHPGGRAVNWGGYAEGGNLLAGSDSPLPSTPNDPNTRDYPWEPGRPYRFRVFRAPGLDGVWRAEVTDLRSGRAEVIRDLGAGGDVLADPVVWSEVFARCEQPSVTVRWSGMKVTTAAGRVVEPTALAVNYQSPSAGGCGNTTVAADEQGVVQVTNTGRQVAQGAVVDLLGRPGRP